MHSATDNGYFKSLDWQRNKGKLEIVGLSLQDDPYCLDKRFGSDMRARLFSWKRMEAYNYFSGYVRTVMCLPFGTGKARCIVVSTRVNILQTWLIAKMEGGIKMYGKREVSDCSYLSHCTSKCMEAWRAP